MNELMLNVNEAREIIFEVLRKRFEDEGIPFRNTVVRALTEELIDNLTVVALES